MQTTRTTKNNKNDSVPLLRSRVRKLIMTKYGESALQYDDLFYSGVCVGDNLLYMQHCTILLQLLERHSLNFDVNQFVTEALHSIYRPLRIKPVTECTAHNTDNGMQLQIQKILDMPRPKTEYEINHPKETEFICKICKSADFLKVQQKVARAADEPLIVEFWCTNKSCNQGNRGSGVYRLG